MRGKDDGRRSYGTFTHPGRYAHLACGGRYCPIDPAFNVLGTCESPETLSALAPFLDAIALTTTRSAELNQNISAMRVRVCR